MKVLEVLTLNDESPKTAKVPFMVRFPKGTLVLILKRFGTNGYGIIIEQGDSENNVGYISDSWNLACEGAKIWKGSITLTF